MELASSLLSPVTAWTWPPVVAFSRRTVLSLFSQITTGQLIVHDAITNITTVCGAVDVEGPSEKADARAEEASRSGRRKGPPRTTLRVLRDTFWVRLLLFADMVRQPGVNVGQTSVFSTLKTTHFMQTCDALIVPHPRR